MKKGSLLTLLLSLIMGVSIFTLAGCGGGGGNGDNNNGGGNNGGDNGGSIEQPDTPPTPAAPELQAANKVATGIKYTYTKSSFKDVNGEKTTFEQMLNTQIEVLVQDILYRITAVYGANENQKIVSPENLVLNKTIESNNQYCFGNSSAKIKLSNLLSKTATHDSTHVLDVDNEKLSVDCVDCYQVAVTAEAVSNTSFNLFYNQNFMNLTGAIEGNNTVLSSLMLVDPTIVGKNAWVGWDSNLDSTYENVLSTYTKSLKMGIASILANKTPTAAYYEAEYNNLLSSISSLGYFEGHKNLIANFIKNKIIGSDLVTKDDAIYSCDYFVENNYIVDSSFVVNAPYNNGTFTAEEIKNSPRLYKGYSVVVPAIVEQALANTFDGTDKTLYPKMSRKAVEVSSGAEGFTDAKEYETFTIMAKQGAKATKMKLLFQGNGSTIDKTITLNYTVKIGSTTGTATKQVTLSALETAIEFDLHAIASSKQFGNYEGNKLTFDKTQALVAEGELNSDGSFVDCDNDNYIKFTVSGLSAGEKFIVKLAGIYDKV